MPRSWFNRHWIRRPKDEQRSSFRIGEICKGLRWSDKSYQIFLILSRLSAIKNADRILMIESGRIVEDGTHESLMQSKGPYFTMMRGSHAEDVIDTNTLSEVDKDKLTQLDKVAEKQMFPQCQQMYESTNSGMLNYNIDIITRKYKYL